VPEIKFHCGEDIKFILVGTKWDLWKDKDTLKRLKDRKVEPITFQQAKDVAKKCGAKGLVFTSSLLNFNVEERIVAPVFFFFFFFHFICILSFSPFFFVSDLILLTEQSSKKVKELLFTP
jgi:hypothetical protein